MCGRYALYGPVSRIRDQFEASIDELPEDFGPRYNAAPMQMLPVIRQRPTGERVVHLLRWGLVPSWSKDQAIAAKLINARAETLAEKPSFRAAFKARRCIIPASGFYEWKQDGKSKQPYFICPADDSLFGFAGLWERWSRGDEDPLDTFTVVTTEASQAMRPLHDRMPVILDVKNYGTWLGNGADPDLLRELVVPCPDQMLRIHPVAKAVGNVRNDNPQLIEPIKA